MGADRFWSIATRDDNQAGNLFGVVPASRWADASRWILLRPNEFGRRTQNTAQCECYGGGWHSTTNVTDQALAGKKAFVPPPTPTGVNSGGRRVIERYWHWAVVVLLAIFLWAPRLSGPIDLRWDGGVYYLLGTSLATGHGYRIPSEPGSPEALQYPPLLPAVVALYERALGSTEPAIVAPWLRISYAAMFLVYALAVFALARKYLRPTFALIATALCLVHIWTIFLSDVLFAEIPFAIVSVVFVLVATNGPILSRPWLREAASFVLATAGFLLRTAGIVLFAGWLIEAVSRRRWQLAFARGMLALLPVALWQAHVERVHQSDEYRHPAYEYQRAPYQNYNVTYFENFRLLDPFRPERGLADKHVLAKRLEKASLEFRRALARRSARLNSFGNRPYSTDHSGDICYPAA